MSTFSVFIFDMGGVLMSHNMQGCIDALVALMGEEGMRSALGLLTNGEGLPDSLMERFESGEVDEESFVRSLLAASRAGTTPDDIVRAWNMMHGGIPQWKLDVVRRLHDEGHHVLLLSNSNPLHQRDIVEHYDMSMFDYCFYSHEVHSHKPERRIYEVVEAYLHSRGWDSLPVVFIDDIAANREVGASFGWHTLPDISDL